MLEYILIIKGIILKSDNKNLKLLNFKRQWGAEKKTEPLSIVHAKPTTKKITFSRLAIVITVLFWISYLVSTVIRQFFNGPQTFSFMLQSFGYLIVVTFLTFSALMYLVSRAGAYQRFAKHVRVPRAELDQHFFSNNSPSITVLVPSYNEEPDVIRKTLMSAAIQEFPNTRVVLLIDDNPNPTDSSVADKLDATRNIPSQITNLFKPLAVRFNKAESEFRKKYGLKTKVSTKDLRKLIDEYKFAYGWLDQIANQETVKDHVDLFFANHVLKDLSRELVLVSRALEDSLVEGISLPVVRVAQLYNRLRSIFNFDIEVFERKKYASLSHESNKAMNLNSYIGLMGGRYEERLTPDGLILLPVKKPSRKDLVIPDSEFILTLDADSILLRDYCLRLVYFLEQPGNEKIAVTQTPYSSFRGAATRIERLAAATTDIQHILHQGMTYFDATFWVGANAVIRKKALEDIVEKEWIGGFEIKRYIQDRTVIEDTESSIDLCINGWSLYNYPERLSYSATPPDFGSLIVQRRRWANGGLLILPKLLKHARERKKQRENILNTGFLLRLNYMASITWASFGLIFLLAYPYDGRLLSPFVILAALPYFLAMASDLKYCGYKRTDVLRIYGFNLILLPVNLAGVIKSLQQSITAKKIPFARTPKVKNRTIAPSIYILTPLIIIGLDRKILVRDYFYHNWINAFFAGFNALLAGWAVIAYIGISNIFIDVWKGFINWLYVDVKKVEKTNEEKEQEFDWRSVLYHGDIENTSPHHIIEMDYSNTILSSEDLK